MTQVGINFTQKCNVAKKYCSTNVQNNGFAVRPAYYNTHYVRGFTRVTSILNEVFAHSLVCSDRIFSDFSQTVF